MFGPLLPSLLVDESQPNSMMAREAINTQREEFILNYNLLTLCFEIYSGYLFC